MEHLIVNTEYAQPINLTPTKIFLMNTVIVPLIAAAGYASIYLLFGATPREAVLLFTFAILIGKSFFVMNRSFPLVKNQVFASEPKTDNQARPDSNFHPKFSAKLLTSILPELLLNASHPSGLCEHCVCVWLS